MPGEQPDAVSGGAPLSLLDAIHAGQARALDLRGADLAGLDLRGADLAGVDLRGADLRGADLTAARLMKADLEQGHLEGAVLDQAELVGANLCGANLNSVSAVRAGLGHVDLSGADLISADLREATLSGAVLKDASLLGARMTDASLMGVDLSGADLSGADLSGALLDDVCVRRTNMARVVMRRARLARIRDYESANWLGVNLQGADFTGAWLLRRHVYDENYIAELRGQSWRGELLYWGWWVTSDCGRSASRWSAWIVLLSLVFAGLYEVLGVDFGEDATPVASIYFSVVTLTSLGYGDVTPHTTVSQITAITEASLGYIMLGGLMSIFTNKMARRAD